MPPASTPPSVHKNPSLPRALWQAWQGIGLAVRQEANLRRHLVTAAFALLLTLVLHVSLTRALLVILAIGGVLTAELLNSALELLADALHSAHHEGIQSAKDIAAGAVLMMSLVALCIGLLIFVPALWQQLVE